LTFLNTFRQSFLLVVIIATINAKIMKHRILSAAHDIFVSSVQSRDRYRFCFCFCFCFCYALLPFIPRSESLSLGVPTVKTNCDQDWFFLSLGIDCWDSLKFWYQPVGTRIDWSFFYYFFQYQFIDFCLNWNWNSLLRQSSKSFDWAQKVLTRTK
jgi:hypothetical protein